MSSLNILLENMFIIKKGDVTVKSYMCAGYKLMFFLSGLLWTTNTLLITTPDIVSNIPSEEYSKQNEKNINVTQFIFFVKSIFEFNMYNP